MADLRNDGIWFENQCAEILKNMGYTVQSTAVTGDQGVDLIAVAAGGKTAIIQCKDWTSPVGNKAVQEVYTGRAHHRADFAMVVSRVGFTRAARQLAETTDVKLLTLEELRGVRQLFGPPGGSPPAPAARPKPLPPVLPSATYHRAPDQLTATSVASRHPAWAGNPTGGAAPYKQPAAAAARPTLHHTPDRPATSGFAKREFRQPSSPLLTRPNAPTSAAGSKLVELFKQFEHEQRKAQREPAAPVTPPAADEKPSRRWFSWFRKRT